MTCVEPQRMRMTRSFSHYTDGVRFYLSRKLKIFWEDQKIAAFGSFYRGRDPCRSCRRLRSFDFASAQNNQTPQHLMLFKPQYPLQRIQHRLRVLARKAAADPALGQFIVKQHDPPRVIAA